MQQVMEVTGPAALEDVLTRLYPTVRVCRVSTSDPGAMRVEASELGPLRFDHLSVDIGFGADVAPPGAMLIGRMRAGTATYDSLGAQRCHGPGEIHLCAQPDAPYTVEFDGLVGNLVVVDPLILGTVAERGLDDGNEPVGLTDYRPYSPETGRAWARAYDYLNDLARADAAPATPLVVEAATRLLAASSLAAFPNNAITEPTRTDRHDAHPDTLRRAIDFTEANADLPLTMADIARGANVSIRAVQLTFRRHLATTPMRYLRRVRLDLARIDLQTAVPGDKITVTAIAMRWGYSSSSRFAAHYRAAYGEPPHRTLKRSRGEHAA